MFPRAFYQRLVYYSGPFKLDQNPGDKSLSACNVQHPGRRFLRLCDARTAWVSLGTHTPAKTTAWCSTQHLQSCHAWVCQYVNTSAMLFRLKPPFFPLYLILTFVSAPWLFQELILSSYNQQKIRRRYFSHSTTLMQLWGLKLKNWIPGSKTVCNVNTLFTGLLMKSLITLRQFLSICRDFHGLGFYGCRL